MLFQHIWAHDYLYARKYANVAVLLMRRAEKLPHGEYKATLFLDAVLFTLDAQMYRRHAKQTLRALEGLPARAAMRRQVESLLAEVKAIDDEAKQKS